MSRKPRGASRTTPIPPRVLAWYRSTFGQALIGAALVWAALPPLDNWLGTWPLAWIAPIWWVGLIRREALPGRRPYLALWLVGFLFWLAALYWLCLPHWATSFGWLALGFYQAFYLPVFIGLSRVAVHKCRVPAILAAPVVWTGLELARGHLLTGFTMASLGHTQYRWLELIQISDLVGAYGVSFVVMFGAACLGQMIPREGRRPVLWPLVPLGAMLAAVLAYGQWRMAVQSPAPQARIALIQGSIDIQLKSDESMRPYIFSHYRDLSREAVREAAAEGRKPDLVVWPETMFRDTLLAHDEDVQPPDGWEHSREDFLRLLAREEVKRRSGMAAVAAELDTALLLGVDTLSLGRDGAEVFNSAAYVGRSGELLGRYDKIHLVMFGEYVPFARWLPWLQRLTPLPNSLEAGKQPEAFEVGPLRIAPSICFETVLPHVIRRQVNLLVRQEREPHVLVNLTNDGWFWGSSELDMHLICGVFRAVECRKPLLIAANTGFSAWIDGDGRIRARGPRRATGMILADVAPDPRRSLYLRQGDWFAGGCLAGCMILCAAGFRDWRRRVVSH